MFITYGMNQIRKVFLFDDDEANIRLYSKYFENIFSFKGSQNPHLYQEALKDDVCAILIDVNMPIMNGVELYEKIKVDPQYNGCPLIFISGTSSEEIIVKAINSGSQDFLTRSMKKDEMISRINNKIDFFRSNRQFFKLGNIKIDTTELKVYYSSEKMDLTLTELKIMKFLIREFPKMSSREEINQEVWPDQIVLPTTLNTHLSNLRKKFPKWEYDIQIVKSRGIELVVKDLQVNH
jgi:two-component system alkaline phosphatase synthesis response regulator PhoP